MACPQIADEENGSPHMEGNCAIKGRSFSSVLAHGAHDSSRYRFSKLLNIPQDLGVGWILGNNL
jgi:hypothetical protein